MKHPQPALSWLAPRTASSKLFSVFHRLAELAMLSGVDESENLRNRRISIRQMAQLAKTLGKDTRTMKQLLIKRPDLRDALASKFSPLHADWVEAGERRESTTR